jgi:hypothetical protein
MSGQTIGVVKDEDAPTIMMDGAAAVAGSRLVERGQHSDDRIRRLKQVWCGALLFLSMVVVGCAVVLLRTTCGLEEPEDNDFPEALLPFSRSLLDNGTGPPPYPSEEAVADWQLRGNSSATDSSDNLPSDRRLAAIGLKEGVPYIIKSKYPGTWFDAELSWDGQGRRRRFSHPMASLEFSDPTDWELRSSGSYWRIVNLSPGSSSYFAELSWDGSGRRRRFGHPMASVEFHDPCDWEFQHSHDNQYKIVSKYPWSWHNAELSWDGSGRRRRFGHPMVSVEHNDPVLWEVSPAYSMRGKWQSVASLITAPGAAYEYQVTRGISRHQEWSRSDTVTASMSSSVQAGFEKYGFGISSTVESSVAREISSSFTDSFTTNYEVVKTMSFPVGDKATTMWRFVFEATNNHHLYKGEKVTIETRAVEVTGSYHEPPKCLPGFCQFDTGCQVCTHARGCMLSTDCGVRSEPCKADRSSSCPIWRQQGYCDEKYVAWMLRNCEYSCVCG